MAIPDPTSIEQIASTILGGFDHHYSLFRTISAAARDRFEQADWSAAAKANGDRIQMYDLRVSEAVETVLRCFPETASDSDEQLWPRVKAAYIGQLHDHLQPECAETFYNSVACRVLNRRYYHNRNIFWRPSVSLEHLHGEEPTYRCYYPGERGLRRCLLQMLQDFSLLEQLRNLRRDVCCLLQALEGTRGSDWQAFPNYQIQVLGSLFYRNKAAYIVGREINGAALSFFVIPVLRSEHGGAFVDAFLSDPGEIAILFSFSRAYFMVDMPVPSAYVEFLRSGLPRKPIHELYSMLGLQKQGKTIFYREMQHHLRHSSDNFVIAPGIKGMVMLVFTLPSIPFVFKIIRDRFEPPKEASRQEVKDKYQLVKLHDRVGRLADTLEFSNVALPINRVSDQLLAALQTEVASSIELGSDELVIKHVYIERRMSPLNEYLATATGAQREHAIKEFGNSIRDLAGANIFPGDMMLKNFGVTRHNRVVFYDYDEIRYLTECNFRRQPPALSAFEDLLDTPCYSVGPDDVFPEQFHAFFFSDPADKALFYADHACLIEPDYWKEKRQQILAGGQCDVFPYPDSRRFRNLYGQNGCPD